MICDNPACMPEHLAKTYNMFLYYIFSYYMFSDSVHPPTLPEAEGFSQLFYHILTPSTAFCIPMGFLDTQRLFVFNLYLYPATPAAF